MKLFQCCSDFGCIKHATVQLSLCEGPAAHVGLFQNLGVLQTLIVCCMPQNPTCTLPLLGAVFTAKPLRKTFVERLGWMSADVFTELFAVCQCMLLGQVSKTHTLGMSEKATLPGEGLGPARPRCTSVAFHLIWTQIDWAPSPNA